MPKASPERCAESAYNPAMTDHEKTELTEEDKQLIDIPEEITDAIHPPVVHVSTPFDGPEGKPETESDDGKKV